MKRTMKSAGADFKKMAKDFGEKAKDYGEKAKNKDNWDSFKNMGKGQNEWFKQNTSNFKQNFQYQSPKEFFNSFKSKSDGDKKKIMRVLFLGFCGLYLVKTILSLLFGGRRQP